MNNSLNILNHEFWTYD